MKKKMLSLLLVGAMASSMLVPAAVSAEENDKVKLTFYGWSDEESYLQPLFDAFNEQSETSYIEPQYCAVGEYEEVVLSALSAGTPIDVLAINGLSPMSNYQTKEILMDMTEFADAAGFDPAATYQDTYSGANEGGMYGIPYRMAVWFMYYNKDMFDKYGIEIPKTFDNLEAAMQKFVDNGVTPLSEGVAEYPLQHLWWQLVLSKANDKFIKNYEMYDGDVDWQGEATTYATKTIKDWVSKGYISKDCTGTKAEDAGQGFMNGTYPMFFSGTWWFGRFQSDMKNANWTFSTFPDTDKVVGSSGNIWVIPENSKKKDLAAQFIDITLSDEVQDLMGNSGGLPIAADPDKITDEKTKELITSFNGVLEKNALGFYPDWPTSTFYDELNSSLQELVNGTSGVKDVLNQMKDNYDKGVEAAGVKS